jgi:hypothetical protein
MDTTVLVADTPSLPPSRLTVPPRVPTWQIDLNRFLASLSEGQWRKISSTGIGLKDLSERQQGLFLNYLGPESWIATATVDEEGIERVDPCSQQRLTELQRASMRVVMGIEAQIILFPKSGGVILADFDSFRRGKAGNSYVVWRNFKDQDAPRRFIRSRDVKQERQRYLLRKKVQAALEAQILKANPIRLLRFFKDDPLALPDSLFDHIKKKSGRGTKRFVTYRARIADLSPSQQALLFDWAEVPKERRPSRLSTPIWIKIRPRISFNVPDVGLVHVPVSDEFLLYLQSSPDPHLESQLGP